jgi:phosphoserine phosphatase
LDLEGLHSEIFRYVLKGLLLADLETEATEFLSSCEDRVCPIIFQALQKAQAAGHRAFLLSSSPDFLVSRIARKFSFDRFTGTNYLVDKEGKLCEISLLITGPKKKEIAGQWLGGSSSVVAYSDSFEDLSLLEWAGLPIVIRPCRKLKKHALRCNWCIL